MNQYSICILDDHPVVPLGIKTVMDHTGLFKVVGTFQNSKSFFTFLQNDNVDIVIIDIDIHNENGLEILKELKKTNPEIKAIVYSMHESEGFFREAVLAGANAYISKADDMKFFPEILRRVLKGEFYFSKVFSPFHNKDAPIQQLDLKHQIIKFLIEGEKQKDIAKKLNKSEKTIEYHVRKLKDEHNVNSLSTLVLKLQSSYFA
ncbi:MAG: response regulator transcription factor [Leptospiraceae bacterium]|nr:response regulator transcription factor [Leptospiraceae bacterium]